jgi:hypothetical protein
MGKACVEQNVSDIFVLAIVAFFKTIFMFSSISNSNNCCLEATGS